MPSVDFCEIFAKFCVDIFNNKKAIENNKGQIDCQEMHKSMSSFLNVSFGNSNGVEKEAIYAMAALADEVFLNTDWEGKKYWEEHMLEFQYFKSQIAGEEIFNRINNIMSENDQFSTKKAEIYLKALSLGFKGKYRDAENGQIEIDLYRNKLFEFIEKNDKSVFLMTHRLFQKEYTYTIPTIHRKLLPDAAIVNYVCTFFLFMFLTISSVVWVFETRDIRRLLFNISCIALRE